MISYTENCLVVSAQLNVHNHPHYDHCVKTSYMHIQHKKLVKIFGGRSGSSWPIHQKFYPSWFAVHSNQFTDAFGSDLPKVCTLTSSNHIEIECCVRCVMLLIYDALMDRVPFYCSSK